MPQVVSLDFRTYKDCLQGTCYHQHHAQDSMPHVTLLSIRSIIFRISYADIAQSPVASRLGAPVAGNLERMYHLESLKPLPNP